MSSSRGRIWGGESMHPWQLTPKLPLTLLLPGRRPLPGYWALQDLERALLGDSMQITPIRATRPRPAWPAQPALPTAGPHLLRALQRQSWRRARQPALREAQGWLAPPASSSLQRFLL